MARIIITGTNGFIGKALAKELHKSNEILALTTNIKKCLFNSITYEEFLNGNSKKLNEFSPTHFIHCAAIAHKISPFRKKKKSFINEINKFLPSKLAIKCKELKIKRFIFISSIGVFGNQKIINKNSKYKPNNFYSLTKSEAEKLLKKILNKSNCELTIIRPTIGYKEPLKIKAAMRKLIDRFAANIPSKPSIKFVKFITAVIKINKNNISIDEFNKSFLVRKFRKFEELNKINDAVKSCAPYLKVLGKE